MFIYLSKKIAMPNNNSLHCLAWNKEHGYIACGGDGNLLKVILLESERDVPARGMPSSTFRMNQPLEGHQGVVQVVTWNEGSSQKLTSSDENGLIVVWMLYNGSWFEEMINNRNKSYVTGMSWNPEGEKICIVYEDGAVIVGSLDGNRVWGKELKGSPLTGGEWSPDSRFILFSFQTEIHAYDASGNFVTRLPNLCPGTDSPQIKAVRWYNGRGGYVEEKGPSLALAFGRGWLQLMRDITDEDAVLLDANMQISDVQWNNTGSLLAVAGRVDGVNTLKMYSHAGTLIQVIKVPGKNLVALSWNGPGLRLALAIDHFVFLANVRPDYVWSYFSNTVVYTFRKPGKSEVCIAFWNLNSGEKTIKCVKKLQAVAACKEHCVLATTTEEGDQQALVLCNNLGTPILTKMVDFPVCFVACSKTLVIGASREMFCLWNYHHRQTMDVMPRKEKQLRIYHVDDSPKGESSMDLEAAYELAVKSKLATNDPITCICATEKILVVGRESGRLQQYGLSTSGVVLQDKLNIDRKPIRISLNSNSSKLAVLDVNGIFAIFLLDSGSEDKSKMLYFERRDVWDFMWALDNPDMFAVTEKTRMYLFRGTDPEEPVNSTGYICSFQDLQIRTVLLDDVLQEPENPNLDCVIDMEAKSLRDTRDLLEKVGIQDTVAFLEDNPHPRLWRLLAEAALQKLNLAAAESAFVRCHDYQGIQFVKKLERIQNEKLQKAEVFAYFKDFDAAEKIYQQEDRRDLMIGLRKNLGNWFQVANLVTSGGGDDTQLEEAKNSIGDYFFERQKWEEAAKYFQQGGNLDKQAECYYMDENYEQLARLASQLPENHRLLSELAAMFVAVGMCEEAVNAFIKANKIKAAIDCCVQLNQWALGIDLAKKHDIPEIGALLAKYAQHLLEKNRILSAIELYRKANCFLEAAQLLNRIAKSDSKLHPLRIKKLYVLAALLVDEHNKQRKNKREHSSSLSNILSDHPQISSEVIDRPWHFAEGYHLYSLAQRQLQEGRPEDALMTAVRLRDYEDVLGPERTHSLVALVSAANHAFGICSKAFLRLETALGGEEEGKEYEALAAEIFVKYSPKNQRANQVECPKCETPIPEWSTNCTACSTKFPACMATGKPILELTYWQCSVCKQKAQMDSMTHRKSCPLCHTSI